MTTGWEQALDVACNALPARQWSTALANALCAADGVVHAHVLVCPPDDIARSRVAHWPDTDDARTPLELLSGDRVVAMLRAGDGPVLGALALTLRDGHGADHVQRPLRAIAEVAAHTLTTALDLAGACVPSRVDIDLPPRQREIADLVCAGMSDLNIATHLNITEATVGTHLSKIFRKLDVHSRVDLVRKLRGI